MFRVGIRPLSIYRTGPKQRSCYCFNKSTDWRQLIGKTLIKKKIDTEVSLTDGTEHIWGLLSLTPATIDLREVDRMHKFLRATKTGIQRCDGL
jgi:hypothetical protein